MPEEDAERQLSIHADPETMAGVYANFANVSHSDYEFSLTFIRLDHEVEEGEVPGVVVSRVNLAPRFMRELIDAMEDNFSKWKTREGSATCPSWTASATRVRPGRAAAAPPRPSPLAGPLGWRSGRWRARSSPPGGDHPQRAAGHGGPLLHPDQPEPVRAGRPIEAAAVVSPRRRSWSGSQAATPPRRAASSPRSAPSPSSRPIRLAAPTLPAPIR